MMTAVIITEVQQAAACDIMDIAVFIFLMKIYSRATMSGPELLKSLQPPSNSPEILHIFAMLCLRNINMPN